MLSATLLNQFSIKTTTTKVTISTKTAAMPTAATGATDENMLYIVIGLLVFLIACFIVVVCCCCRRERHNTSCCGCCWGEVKGGSEEQPLRIENTQRVAVEMSDIPQGMVSLRTSSNDTKFNTGVRSPPLSVKHMP